VGLLIIGQVAVHVLCAQTAGGGSGWTMAATHVGGTAICAMVLRRGEDALWTLAERLGVRVGVTAPVVAIAPRHVPTVPVVAVRSRRLARLTHVVEGRGPPVGLA
jgi:hypothetical protein